MLGSILSVAAPVIGGLIGGGSTSTPTPASAPAPYVPPNQAQVAQNLQNQMDVYGRTAAAYTGMQPSYANTAFQSLYANPYADAYRQAAQQAGGMAAVNAPALQQQGLGLIGGSQAALLNAFDPQGQLYNLTRQRLEQNINAQQALRGLGVSPQGAQDIGTALGQFDINWQNQQLQRELAALQGASGASTAGGNLAMAAPQQQLYYGQMPYQVGQQIGQGQFGAIGALSGAQMQGLTPLQQQMQNEQAYLGLGQAAQANAANQAYQAAAMQQQGAQGGAYFGQQLAPVIGKLGTMASGYFGLPSWG